MPETPDFESIARRVAEETGVGRLEEWDPDDSDRVIVAIREQLRLVWNARGAADIAKTEHELEGETFVGDLTRALRSLDR